MKIIAESGKQVSISTSKLAKKIWGFIKPCVKKALQIGIVWLHEQVSKLEVYLLKKIDEVEIE